MSRKRSLGLPIRGAKQIELHVLVHEVSCKCNRPCAYFMRKIGLTAVLADDPMSPCLNVDLHMETSLVLTAVGQNLKHDGKLSEHSLLAGQLRRRQFQLLD